MDINYEYGVDVSNRFELSLEENEDPLEVLQKQELKIEAEKRANLKWQKKVEGLKLISLKNTEKDQSVVKKNTQDAAKTKQKDALKYIKADDSKVLVKLTFGKEKGEHASTCNNSPSSVEYHENFGTDMKGKGKGERPPPTFRGHGHGSSNFHYTRQFYNQVGRNYSEPGANDAENASLRSRGGRGRGPGYHHGRGSINFSQRRDFQYKQELYQDDKQAEGEAASGETDMEGRAMRGWDPRGKWQGGRNTYSREEQDTGEQSVGQKTDLCHEASELEEHKAEQADIMMTQQSDCKTASTEHKTDWGVEQSEEPASSDITSAMTLQQQAALDSEMTLEEWRALQGSRDKPAFNIRKAGEGEDESQWQPMFALDKKKDEDQDSEDNEEGADYSILYPQRAGKQKKIQIDICFTDAERLRRRGGRGQNRGSERWDVVTFGDYGKEDQGWKRGGRRDDDSSYNDDFEGRASYRSDRGRGYWYGAEPFNTEEGVKNGPYESTETIRGGDNSNGTENLNKNGCQDAENGNSGAPHYRGRGNRYRGVHAGMEGPQDSESGENAPFRGSYFFGRGNKYRGVHPGIEGPQDSKSGENSAYHGSYYCGRGNRYRGVHAGTEGPQDSGSGENAPFRGSYFFGRGNKYRCAQGSSEDLQHTENGEETPVSGNNYYNSKGYDNNYRNDRRSCGGQWNGDDMRGNYYRGWRGRERGRRHGRYIVAMPDDPGSAGVIEQGSQANQHNQLSAGYESNNVEAPQWMQNHGGSKKPVQPAFKVDDEKDFPSLGLK